MEGIKNIGLLILGLYLLFDLIVLFYNITKRSGPGGCSKADKGWIIVGPLTLYLKKKCDLGGGCTSLGTWEKYKTNKNTDSKNPKNALCASEINKVWEDASTRNIVQGYNMTELLAYVIVPTVTILGILYGFILTNMNKGEWTFWLMIATIIATGLTSIAYDTDIKSLPTQQNPLEYITSKLDLDTTDELEISLISRKQNGDECLISGTVIGPTALRSESEPLSYSGECKSKDFL